MVVLQEETEDYGGNMPLPIHPLLIDHVVKKILEYAVSSHNVNLLSCRSVCKIWNQMATSLYKSQQQVEVGNYSTSVPRFRRLIKLRKSCPNNFSKKNSKTFAPSWPFPFVRFRLCQEVFQPIYASVITDFFQTFQDTLEVLDIWLDLRSSLVEVPIHSKSKLSSFANLKTLVYDDRRVILHGSEDNRGSLLKTLVEHAPNIRNLSIRFQRDFRGSLECASETVLNRIRNIFSRVEIQRSLKFLKLDMHINDPLLNSLKCCNLRVETLELALRGSSFTFPVFQNFMESLQMNLMKLKICYIERDSSCLLVFPAMTALRELEIEGTDAFAKHSVAFGDLTFQQNFPQLQSLRISIWASVHLRWAQFFQNKQPIWTIKELKLPGELCDKTMMADAARMFPNLKKLQISVYSLTLDSLQTIFEGMPQLEELTVTKFPSLWDRNETNIDHILTGISISDCDKLVEDNVVLENISNDKLMILKTSAGLTDLKKLKKLSMPDLQYQASYTDITGYLAFRRMPNLKYLNVGRSYLGNSCLMQLTQKFPEMEEQRKMLPMYLKEPEDDDDGSYLDLPGDTCVYL
ncbi:hypothetical protein Ocin01_08312 [Orchesella cincta]|uniref:F-box domain-containing protein n=1 Tax=Orchesella cincta TaxID=48709 RepID=A0A1D2MZF0_ORCCI|nr:hypothetical protein Ocin01_08312 [Orchesella cincta]